MEKLEKFIEEEIQKLRVQFEIACSTVNSKKEYVIIEKLDELGYRVELKYKVKASPVDNIRDGLNGYEMDVFENPFVVVKKI